VLRRQSRFPQADARQAPQRVREPSLDAGAVPVGRPTPSTGPHEVAALKQPFAACGKRSPWSRAGSKERAKAIGKICPANDLFVTKLIVRLSDDPACAQVVHLCDACGYCASNFLLVYVGRMSVTGGDFLLAIMGLVHTALFGGRFYGISVFISRACAGASERVRLGIAAIIGIVLAVVTLQPWYGIGDGFHSLYYIILHR
jgi:hypothetical protein